MKYYCIVLCCIDEYCLLFSSWLCVHERMRACVHVYKYYVICLFLAMMVICLNTSFPFFMYIYVLR